MSTETQMYIHIPMDTHARTRKHIYAHIRDYDYFFSLSSRGTQSKQEYGVIEMNSLTVLFELETSFSCRSWA